MARAPERRPRASRPSWRSWWVAEDIDFGCIRHAQHALDVTVPEKIDLCSGRSGAGRHEHRTRSDGRMVDPVLAPSSAYVASMRCARRRSNDVAPTEAAEAARIAPTRAIGTPRRGEAPPTSLCTRATRLRAATATRPAVPPCQALLESTQMPSRKANPASSGRRSRMSGTNIDENDEQHRPLQPSR